MNVTQEKTKQVLKTVVDYCLLDELNGSSRIMALGACLVALHYKALAQTNHFSNVTVPILWGPPSTAKSSLLKVLMATIAVRDHVYSK